MVGKIEGGRRSGATEDEMVGWHHWLSGHVFEPTLGGGEGQGSLVCCCLWGHKESDTTEQLNNDNASLRDRLSLSIGKTPTHCDSQLFICLVLSWLLDMRVLPAPASWPRDTLGFWNLAACILIPSLPSVN